MVNNPPSNAGFDADSIPGQGTKVPHAAGQLSLSTATTEPVSSRAHAPQLERSPHAAMKGPHTARKDLASRKERSCVLQ